MSAEILKIEAEVKFYHLIYLKFDTMSTFFEKLTGAGASFKPLPQDTSDSVKKEQEKHHSLHVPRHEEEIMKAKHLAVTEGENTESSEIPEEGELTVDIYDKGDALVIQSTVAGVKPEDLDIAIANDTVTIRGRRERQEEIEEKSFYYKELFWGMFSRSIILPEEIEEDLAEATYRHGLLTLRLPKKRRGVVQKIKVRVT